MKIFISQPMRNKTDEEIRAERAKAIDECQAYATCTGEKIDIIDSIIDGAPDGAKPLWYLGESLRLLSGADAAYFVRGWSENQGCRIEHMACSEYGIRILNNDYGPIS